MAYQLEVVDLQTLPPAQTVLSAQELAFYNALKVPKRKTEWLGGRLALKKLLCAYAGGAWTDYTILAPGGVGKPSAWVRHSRDERFTRPSHTQYPRGGEPFPSPVEGEGGRRPDEGEINIPFSLTHSNGFAVAALAPKARAIGIDLEKITPRLHAWKTDFFHPSELASQPVSDAFLTSLWTQKEALVKLLGSGLTVNTLDVRVVGGEPVLSGRALEIYNALGRPPLTLETRELIPGFYFSVVFG